MAGPGIRAWEIASQLAEHCEVTLVAPGAQIAAAAPFRLVSLEASPETVANVVRDSSCVLIQGLLLEAMPWLASLSVPLVVDLYDPFNLENLELFAELPDQQRRTRSTHDLGVIRRQLLAGDFFICATERQRDFWLGMLAAVGRVGPSWYQVDPTFRALIDVVPFGMAGQPPEHTRRALKGVYPGIESDDRVILWGGGLWRWLDPFTLLHAVAQLRAKWPNLKVFFMGVRRPEPRPSRDGLLGEVRDLARKLGLLGNGVIFNDWAPYAERHNFLLEADIGVCLSPQHIEARFAFRTRILDYIWAELPTICTEGDAAAEIVERYGLGATTAPGDVDAVRDALDLLLSEPDARRRRHEAFMAAAGALSWSRAVQPLLRFALNPRCAPDRDAGSNPFETAEGPASLGMRAGQALHLLHLAALSFRTGGPVRFWRDLGSFLARRRLRRGPTA